LLWFLPGGHVVWSIIGLLMGIRQLTGAWIGSHLVLRHGTRLGRPVLVATSDSKGIV